MPYYPPLDVKAESAWKQADFNRLVLRLIVLGAFYALAVSYWKWYQRQRRSKQKGKGRRRESQAVTATSDNASQALSRSSHSSNAKLRARSKDHRALPKSATSTCHRKLLAGVMVMEQERDLNQASESEEDVAKDVPAKNVAAGGLSLDADVDCVADASCAAASAGKRRRARSRSRKRGSAKTQDVNDDAVPRPQHHLDEARVAAVKKTDVMGLDQPGSSMTSAPSSQPSTARASTLPRTPGTGNWTAVPARAAKPAHSPAPAPVRPSHVAVAEQGSSARAQSVGSFEAFPPATKAAASQRSSSSAPAHRGLSREPVERVAPTYNPEVGKRRAYSNFRVPRSLQEAQPLPVQRNFSLHARDHEFPSLAVSDSRRSRSSSRKPAAAEAASAAVIKSKPIVEKPADLLLRSAKQPREALLEKLFSSLDGNCDGSLDRSEMLQFARLTGFDGTALDWRREFKILCQERGGPGSQGLSEAAFKSMVNDQSERGCYCQDDELASILKKLRSASSTATFHKPAVPAQAEISTGTKTTTPVAESLIAKKPVASVRASAASLPSHSASSQDKRSQAKEGGEEGFWREGDPISSKPHSGQPLAKEESSVLVETPARAKNRFGKAVPRQVMIAKLFAALDLDADGFLDIAEMRHFAELTGFDGADHVWAEEYRLLCEEHKCQTSKGLGLDAFVELVDDKSGSGCYCKDSELLTLRKKLSTHAQTQASAQQHTPDAKASVATPSGQAVASESQARVAHSDHQREDEEQTRNEDARLPSSGSSNCKALEISSAPKQSRTRATEVADSESLPRRGRDMDTRGKAAPKRRGPAGAPSTTWAPQLPSSATRTPQRAPSRPRTRVKGDQVARRANREDTIQDNEEKLKAEAEISAQAAEISAQAAKAVEKVKEMPRAQAAEKARETSPAQAAEKVKEISPAQATEKVKEIPPEQADEKPPIPDAVKSSALAASGPDDEVQQNQEAAREFNNEPMEFPESGEGGFLFEEFEVSGNDDLGPFAGDAAPVTVDDAQGNSTEGLPGHHEGSDNSCVAGNEKCEHGGKTEEKDELADEAECSQELFLNTCALCGETWLLPMDLGDDFSCQDAGQPCGDEASRAAVSTFLLAEKSEVHADAAAKGTAGAQPRPLLLRQILADGLGVLDATNLLLSNGFEPLYNGELEDVKEELRKAAVARAAAARKQAAYDAEKGNRKRIQRFLHGQLVDLPKGSKYLVEQKESNEDKQKTSVSLSIIGSRSKPMKDPSEKKKGPQTRL